MTLPRTLIVWILLVVCTTVGAAPPLLGHEESDWSILLRKYVDTEGLVDYSGLATDHVLLERTIQTIESTGPQSTPARFPDPHHQLAYYINAYNALVFAGVLRRGPETDSVWTGGLVSGYSFFVGMDVTVDGRKTSLRRLENQIVRKRFQDPRVHAALNCASIGCPQLSQRAFSAATLDAQLDQAIRIFVAEKRHVRYDVHSGTIYLSKIFDWYKSDFVRYESTHGNRDGTVIDYINRYRAADAQLPHNTRIRILDYDKRINRQGQSLVASF